MANYVLTQTGQEVQDILDSMGATYFFSQTATFASDNTYADYPYKGTISLVGVDGTMGVEVTFSNDQAISGNFSPICNTTNGAVEIWSKTNTATTIPTIKIYKNGYVNLNGSSNYMPQSGGNFTGAISVNNVPVLTQATGSYPPTYNTWVNLLNQGIPANPLSSTTASYTAPSNGWLYVYADRGSSSGNTLQIFINGTIVYSAPAYNAYAEVSLTMPIAKGQIIRFNTDSNTATWTLRTATFVA